jgi:hypothetical protein
LFDLAECLGKTVREIEKMPAGEFMEWTGRIAKHPWGRHRVESLHRQAMIYMVAAPNHGSPGKLIDQMCLPWETPKPNVQIVSSDQLAAFLMSIGGQASHE